MVTHMTNTGVGHEYILLTVMQLIIHNTAELKQGLPEKRACATALTTVQPGIRPQRPECYSMQYGSTCMQQQIDRCHPAREQLDCC
jgi:hypothetical protein